MIAYKKSMAYVDLDGMFSRLLLKNQGFGGVNLGIESIGVLNSRGCGHPFC